MSQSRHDDRGPSHYFITPQGPVQTRTISVNIWDDSMTLTTAGGVFSGTRLDPGTAVLMREVTPPPSDGTFLDLGCGYGPIACALGRACPGSQIVAVDVNDLAIRLTTRNAKALGVGTRVHACRPEDVDPHLRFDEIWSNPPIRVGKAVLHEMLTMWLTRLSDDGVAHLVVGKNLGADSLTRWLCQQGFDAARIASAKGFRVIDVHA
ncbi:methyltransferase [Cutibacterium sp. WCA-380-WT-3A]|uniref:Methyltransferase n=1 Tax=Cutibacterium porci TaxID=2605781 RepID=A0A7K0J7Z4_9ACTN|nr:methyltransferase [Cutibacterium porci]MSS46059.1 methyltransferase [Cutibacterium porci]